MQLPLLHPGHVRHVTFVRSRFCSRGSPVGLFCTILGCKRSVVGQETKKAVPD